MQGWFYKHGSQILGPISLDELKTLQSQGALGPDTLVRRSGQWQWVALQSLGELVPRPSPPRPPAPPTTATTAPRSPVPHVSSADVIHRLRPRSQLTTIVLASGGVAMVALLVVVAAILRDRPGSNLQGSTAFPAGTVPTSSSSAKLSSDQIFARLSPGVVKVHVTTGDGGGNGSGFFVHRDGLIATNYHVIEDAVDVTVEDHAGRVIKVADIVDIDPAGDLALLKVEARPEVVLPLAGSSPPAVGSQVYAIGSPRGLKNTISPGLISGLRELDTLNMTLLQTSTPISPGSSGGPLISEHGTVVGITTLGSISSSAQNLNFAVPVNRLRRLMAQSGY